MRKKTEEGIKVIGFIIAIVVASFGLFRELPGREALTVTFYMLVGSAYYWIPWTEDEDLAAAGSANQRYVRARRVFHIGLILSCIVLPLSTACISLARVHGTEVVADLMNSEFHKYSIEPDAVVLPGTFDPSASKPDDAATYITRSHEGKAKSVEMKILIGRAMENCSLSNVANTCLFLVIMTLVMLYFADVIYLQKK